MVEGARAALRVARLVSSLQRLDALRQARHLARHRVAVDDALARAAHELGLHRLILLDEVVNFIKPNISESSVIFEMLHHLFF